MSAVIGAPFAIDRDAKVRLRSRRAILWFWILLGVNSLSLFAMIGCCYVLPAMQYQLPQNFIERGLMSVMEAQLFLLAFWLSFGGLPRRWRSLLVFGLAAGGGLALGASIVAVFWIWNFSYIEGATIEQYLLYVLVPAPLMAGVLLWVTNALFVIPAWYFGAEVGLRRESPLAGLPLVTKRDRTFGIGQILSWTAQVAVPLGLLNLMVMISPSPGNVYWSILQFAMIIACCTPLAVGLLMPQPSFVFLAVALGWVFCVAYFLTAPSGLWSFPRPWWSYVISGLTAGLNLAVLRGLGFCWQPRRAPMGAPVGQASGSEMAAGSPSVFPR